MISHLGLIRTFLKQRKAAVEGIEIVDDIYQYLISDALYNTSYETKNPFAQ